MRVSRLVTLLVVALAAFGLGIPLAASAAPKPLAVATASLPDSIEGKAYSAQLKATGGTAPYTWSIVDGQLPGGPGFSQGKFSLSTSGKITGVQGLFTASSTFTVQVKDKKGLTATRTFTLVTHNMTITTTAVPAAKKGRLYSTKIKFVGGCSNPAWTVAPDNQHGGMGTGKGVFPDGLTIHPGGVVSGVPKTAGTYPFAVLAACQSPPFKPYNPFLPFAWSQQLTLVVS
jgi:hypothetical protein